jgi:hypothetical protein
MELTEGPETSAISNQTPGKHPKENILHVKHGESLKSRVELYLYPTLGHNRACNGVTLPLLLRNQNWTVGWINPVQDRYQWRTVLNATVDF